MRVVDDESSGQEARVVVQPDAVQQPETPGIDEHPRPVRTVEDRVAWSRRGFPAEGVFESRAAAGSDAEAQRTLAAPAPCEHLLNLRGRSIRHLNHRALSGTVALMSARVSARRRASTLAAS